MEKPGVGSVTIKAERVPLEPEPSTQSCIVSKHSIFHLVRVWATSLAWEIIKPYTHSSFPSSRNLEVASFHLQISGGAPPSSLLGAAASFSGK